MAISPIVNQYMQQGSPMDAPQPSADEIFKSQFSDQAFNTLRAKFPSLLNYVVTFKTLDADVEEGSAFGVFVIESSSDLIYIPVAMSDGAVLSCEMFYDKNEDIFYPLNEHTVQEIIAKNNSTDPKLLQKSPRVEDTRQLFINMMRPPTSSNVVLASRHGGIDDLPDKYKYMVQNYLSEENPELLGKVASFYDVEYLAHKLSPREVTPQIEEPPLPSFLSIDTLTQKTAALLSPEEKQQLLADGFLAKHSEESPTLVAPEKDLPKLVETTLRVETYKPTATKISDTCCNGYIFNLAEGNLISTNQHGLFQDPILMCGDLIINTKGEKLRLHYFCDDESILVSDFCACVESLDDYPGFFTIDEFNKKVNDYKEPYDQCLNILIVVPGKHGFKCIDYTPLSARSNDLHYADNKINIRHGKEFVTLSDVIHFGYVLTNGNLTIPSNSYFIISNIKEDEKIKGTYLRTQEELIDNIKVFGVNFTNVNDPVGVSLNSNNKTVTFGNTKLAAQWLHNNYNLDSDQIKTVLNNPKSLVFEKVGYLDYGMQQLPGMPAQYGQGGIPPNTMEMPAGMPSPLPSTMPGGSMPMQPDFSQLQDFAAMQDPDMFDMGVLSAFADNPDIKALLVEYLPDFLNALDKIGRIILLFSYKKKDIDKFYGSEKCSNIMNSCRRIFTILGDLVSSLKSYIHMV